MAYNPDGKSPIVQLNVQYSKTPLGTASLFASLSLSINDGYKVPVFWKDGKVFFSDPMPIPFGCEEPNPYWIGYIFSNQRYAHMTKIHHLYPPIWEFNDNQNRINVDSVFSDVCFKSYRKYQDSSLIGNEEAIAVIADVFMKWHYTKEIINRIFAQNFDPGTGTNSSMVLK